jgi:hypothetical protein
LGFLWWDVFGPIPTLIIRCHQISSALPNPPKRLSRLPENRDVEAQVSGQYPALNRQESLPLGAIQHAWDNAEPFAGVYQVQYNPREVIRLLTREFMTTTIIFPAWENIIDEVVGR